MLYGIIATLLIKLGNFLKDKDANDTGTDDAFGNVCIAMAPAIASLETNSDNAKRKALKVVRDTIDGYLNCGTGGGGKNLTSQQLVDCP